jgi:hypothetical protein
LHAAAVAAATEQLLAAHREYQQARELYATRVAGLRAELVDPARRARLLAIQTMAKLTSAENAGQILGFSGSRARQLIAEARQELAQHPASQPGIRARTPP